MKFKRIAFDISMHAFTLHGVDDAERPVLRRDLKRAEVEPFFAKVGSTEVIMEACGGAHHWGRVLARLGHQVRLIPARYVRPFVRRAKNDLTDAEAINALRGHAAEFGAVAARGTAQVQPLLDKLASGFPWLLALLA